MGLFDWFRKPKPPFELPSEPPPPDLWDQHIDEQSAARFAFFETLGQPDDDVWAPIINPIFQGGPEWPVRPGWRRIVTSDTTIIASDGLSNPFESDERNTGFGVEVLAETAEELPTNPTFAWLFQVVLQVSHNVAAHGRFRELMEARQVLSMELPFDDEEELQPLESERGTVGLWLGQPMASGVTSFPTPAGDVLVITVKLMTPAELDFAINGGADGYRTLRSRYAESSDVHRSSLSRDSVV